jgi:hypothetical protein
VAEQDWSWKNGDPQKRERMERFIEWVLTPVASRIPDSKAGLAKEMGVSEQTLRNYQRDPVFQAQVKDRARALARVDRLPAILDALFETATGGTPQSVAAARTLLEFMDKPSQVDGKADVSEMSTDELVKVALELLHKVAPPVTVP